MNKLNVISSVLILGLTGCFMETGRTSSETRLDHLPTVPEGCEKIEGEDIGDVNATLIVGGETITFTSWTEKDGEGGEFVGFTLTSTGEIGDVNFTVKSGLDFDEGNGGEWENPNGTSGSDAHGISNIIVCLETCEDRGDCPEPTCEELGTCEEPTCEELGNCEEPTCEELGNCEEPTCEELQNCPEPTCEELGTCEEPTCEELGTCPEPTCEELGTCETI